MAFFKKKGTKIINSQTDHTIMKAFTPKIKKKLYIGFGHKRKKEHTNTNSKDIRSVRFAEDFFLRLNVTPSMDKTIQLHENIDAFLEKIGNERLFRDTKNSIKIQSQGVHDMNDETRAAEEEYLSIKGKTKALLGEVEIRNRQVENLEHQILKRQTQLVEKSEIVKRLETELEIQDQSVMTFNKEIEEKQEDIIILQEEIKERDKIIQDIQGQLTEKQTWIVENNNFTEQLSRELEQNNRLIKKTKGELKRRKEELNISLKELQEKKEKMDELHSEISLRNTIIETMEKQLEEQQIALMEKTKLVETLQEGIKERNEEIIAQKQNLQGRLDAFHIEVETRNRIIENFRKQLSENQTNLIEHTSVAEKLQEELKRKKYLLQETKEKQEQKQHDLIQKDNELFAQGLQLQKACAELDMVRGEIDSRNRIIEDIEKQLTEEQTHLVEKTQLAEHLQGELENKQKKVEKQEEELNLIRIQLEKKEQKITDINTELNDRLNDLEFRNSELNGKQELINQLEKDLKESLQSLHEKNTQLLASKRELKEQDDELNQVRRDSEKKWIDFILANIEIRDDREQIKGLNLKLEQREKLLQEARCKFEQINQEFITNREELGERLKTLNKDLMIRSKLLEDLEKQLTDRQMLLVEKTQMSEIHQTELATGDHELRPRMWDDAEKKGNIDSLQTEIISRNHIIEALRKQLTENQIGLLEKTSCTEQLCEKLEEQQHIITETEIELVTKNNELRSNKQDFEKKDSELLHLQTELEVKRKELEIKQQEKANLLKQFQEMFTKLKVTTITNEPIIKMFENQNEKDNPYSIFKVEQRSIQDQKKSLAGDIDHIIKSGQEHMDQFYEDITWTEKIRFGNENEKCFDHSPDDDLKTKKLKDEESK